MILTSLLRRSFKLMGLFNSGVLSISDVGYKPDVNTTKARLSAVCCLVFNRALIALFL